MIYIFHIVQDKLKIYTSSNGVPHLVMDLVKRKNFELAKAVADLDMDTSKTHTIMLSNEIYHVFNPEAF